MRRVLGLDLGSASIGWAVIEGGESSHSILGLGSRIIPYDGNEGKDFEKGTGESRNAVRTRNRSVRRGYDRYQLRRDRLIRLLRENQMYPEPRLVDMPKIQLWELRARAVREEISKQELGRLLLWLNQKRGYKSSRSDSNLDKKDTEYVTAVKNRYEELKTSGQTIGEHFYDKLKRDDYYRVKENVFPREAYVEEFDAICKAQSYLSESLRNEIRNEIIYYQRPLKSQKGLVSICDYERFTTTTDGKERFVGPRVAPKSSPPQIRNYAPNMIQKRK